MNMEVGQTTEKRMTVGDLKKALALAEDNMLVGVDDMDGVVSEVQFAGITNDDLGRGRFFYIRGSGGYSLFPTST